MKYLVHVKYIIYTNAIPQFPDKNKQRPTSSLIPELILQHADILHWHHADKTGNSEIIIFKQKPKQDEISASELLNFLNHTPHLSKSESCSLKRCCCICHRLQWESFHSAQGSFPSCSMFRTGWAGRRQLPGRVGANPTPSLTAQLRIVKVCKTEGTWPSAPGTVAPSSFLGSPHSRRTVGSTRPPTLKKLRESRNPLGRRWGAGARTAGVPRSHGIDSGRNAHGCPKSLQGAEAPGRLHVAMAESATVERPGPWPATRGQTLHYFRQLPRRAGLKKPQPFRREPCPPASYPAPLPPPWCPDHGLRGREIPRVGGT